MLDDCAAENGPLSVIPGSHMDPSSTTMTMAGSSARSTQRPPASTPPRRWPSPGPPAPLPSITCGAVHGSSESRSGRPRSLLNLNYAAADTWPLLTPERSVPLTEDPDAFETLIVRGEATIVPRLANVPVRLPVPGAKTRINLSATESVHRPLLRGEE